MPYTAATMYPDLAIFQWQNPTYPNPRLAAPVSSTATTLTFTAPPLNYDGTVIAKDFLMGIKNAEGYVETVLVKAATPGNLSADGLTAINVVRGIRLTGLDYTTGDSDLAVDFDQDASVFCNVNAVERLILSGAFTGTIASGGTSWKIGDGTDADITVTAYNADGNKPFFQYDKDTNAWVYSNDGVSSTPFGTGAGVTGGDGITVTAGDIDIDTSDTTIFVKTSSGSSDENKAPILDSSGKLATGFIPDDLFVNIFGDASDGSVTISVDTDLSRDMFYDDLTIDSTKTLNTKGYRVFVKGTLTNNGIISCDGGNGGNGENGNNGTAGGVGAASTGGTAGSVNNSSGSIFGGVAGVAGGNGGAGQTNNNPGVAGSNGTNGGAATQAIGNDNGVQGGSGGTGGSKSGNPGLGAGGSAGSAGTTTRSVTIPRNINNAISQIAIDGSTIGVLKTQASGSGGGGGGGGTSSDGDKGGGGGAGGGSGASGGTVLIVADTIVNDGTIRALGGNGGNGGNGSNSENGYKSGAAGGGGGGGNGGAIIIVYRTMSGAGSTSAAGGTKGSKGTDATGTAGNISPTSGSDGSNGTSGDVILLQI